MKTKVISVLLCLILVITAFSGCDNVSLDNTINVNSSENGELTDATGQSSEEQNKDASSTDTHSVTNNVSNTVDEIPDDNGASQGGASGGANQNSDDVSGETNDKADARDSRLYGIWNATSEIPINENGATVTAYCSIAFREDGTYEQITTEEQAKRMIIDTYLIVFNCKNEQELDKYIRVNKGTTLEGYVIMALAEMTDEDLYVKGTWETKDNNTLYETFIVDGEKNVETATYVFSKDGTAVKLNIENGTGDTMTMILRKA